MKIIIRKKNENFYTASLMDDEKFLISSGHENIEEIENIFLPNCKRVFETDDIELVFCNENVDIKS